MSYPPTPPPGGQDTPAAAGAQQPGWYPDPMKPGNQREWNGADWVGPSVPLGAGSKGAFPKWLIPVIACVGLGVVALIGGAIAGSPEDEETAEVSAESETTEAEDDPTTTEAEEEEEEPTTTEAPTTTTEAPTTTTIDVAAVEAEINRVAQESCAAAGTSGDAPMVEYDVAWETVADRNAVQRLADDCAANARQAAIDGAGPIEIDAVVRDPDAVIGQLFRIAVVVAQFDAATGPCTFRGYYDNEPREYSFEYEGDNAVFTSTEPACPVLDGIDNDDVVWLTVESTGSISYDTQIGGSTTVPAFEVLRAEIIRKE